MDSDCNPHIETVLKAHALKMKYEAAESLYRILGIEDTFITNHRTFLHLSKSGLNTYFEAIKGQTIDEFERPAISSEQRSHIAGISPEERNRDFKQRKDSISRSQPVPVDGIPAHEMKKYVNQIDCTPQQAREEYLELIQNIRANRELYVSCINSEISKDNLSRFAKEEVFYSFHEPGSSLIGPRFTKLDFLKVFKEFLLNDDEEMLPDGVRAYAYLKCGCKIP